MFCCCTQTHNSAKHPNINILYINTSIHHHYFINILYNLIEHLINTDAVFQDWMILETNTIGSLVEAKPVVVMVEEETPSIQVEKLETPPALPDPPPLLPTPVPSPILPWFEAKVEPLPSFWRARSLSLPPPPP